MMKLEYLVIVVLILQILIILGMIALRSYATKKGENLATTEDIGKITKEVESIKNEFSTQLGRLKADLSADMQRQLSLFGKRNEALTQFFENSSTAVTFLRTPIHFSHEDLDGFDRHIKRGQEYIVRADLSYRRLRLYVQEESILTAAEKARTAFSTLHITWFEKMMDCRDAFVIEAAEWERAGKKGDYSFFEGDTRNRPSRQAFDNLWQDIDGSMNALEDSLKEYANALYAHLHSADKSKALTATTGT